jgi:3-hydroxyacyl-[acyl-carrier-protein] dehydratase
MSLTLPLDYQAIERILPHRYPFLLVDRVTDFELDKRIVGIKNVSRNEPLLWDDGRGTAVLPPTILTEAVAQVGAILILAKPENRNKLIFFGGIERLRYRRLVRPGDSLIIEAEVQRLRSKVGVLQGRAHVAGEIVMQGRMTFALGDRDERAAAPAPSSR